MRLAALTIAVALLLPAAANAEVTIKVGDSGGEEDKYRETLYPNGFRIKGKTGTYRGPVTLEVDGFPFDGNYTDYGPSVSTTDEGEYVFPKVVLGRNAMVRARAGGERSKAIQLYVHPGVKRKERVAGDEHIRVSFTYLGHPGFAPPPDAFFVYIFRNTDRKARRLGGARTMTSVGDGKWRYTGLVRLPRGNYRYGIGYCTRGLSAAGYGRVWPIDRACGKSSFTS